MSQRAAGVSSLVLFHGAGADRDHPLFLAIEDVLTINVDRINFPYRQKGPGRRPPDRMPKLIDAVNQASAAASEAASSPQETVVVGGRSMGGRAASMAIAEGMPTAGLVLLSYPLHPPGKPDKLRVDHIDKISCPTLLIHGTKDPFGRRNELEPYLERIPGPLTTHWLEGAGHAPNSQQDEIVEYLTDWLEKL